MSTRGYTYDSPGERDEQISHIAHAAATGTETLCVWRAPCIGKLMGIDWVPSAAVTGAATNYTNINLINRGTDGNSTTEIANKDFASGTNAADFTAVAIYSPAAGSELALSEGQVISCTFEKVGNGLDLPSGNFVFTYLTK